MANKTEEKYGQLAESIVSLVGGKENITGFMHCVTRLRFNVRDKSKVDEKAIEEIPNVVGINWAGNQLQIIVGQAVADAYELILKRNDLSNLASGEVGADGDDAAADKKKFSIMSIFEFIAGCIIPILPVLLATGMLKVFMTLLQYVGLLDPASTTYTVLNFVSDAGFYFMPIYIGRSAAKKAGANEALGMLIGGIMVHPALVQAAADGTALDLFGLPVYLANYTSSILPVIMCCALMGPIERFFAKHVPEIIRSVGEPFLTLVVMIPLTLCVVAPIGSFLGTYVAMGVNWLYEHCGFLALGIMAAVNPFFVMTGMHSALISIGINSFMTLGYETLVMPTNFISQLTQGAAALAVGIKTKKTNLKSLAISSATTALLAGVTEPAMYGVNLKLWKPMVATMIGGACAGVFAGLTGVTCYVPGGSGVFYIPSFIGGPNPGLNVLYTIISGVIGIVVTFVVCMVLYKDEDPETDDQGQEA